MHLLSLAADRLWLVKDGRVAPYEEDLEAYRAYILAGDAPKKAATAAAPKAPKRASRDQLLALRAEVRKCEERMAKLDGMRDKLATKLADPALYEPERKGDMAVWQKKYAEVMDAVDRAEDMWMTAQEKLEAAQK